MLFITSVAHAQLGSDHKGKACIIIAFGQQTILVSNFCSLFLLSLHSSLSFSSQTLSSPSIVSFISWPALITVALMTMLLPVPSGQSGYCCCLRPSHWKHETQTYSVLSKTNSNEYNRLNLPQQNLCLKSRDIKWTDWMYSCKTKLYPQQRKGNGWNTFISW